MATKILQPDEELNFALLFEIFTTLNKSVEYTFKVVGQSSDFTFITKSLTGNTGEPILKDSKPFNRLLKGDMYAIKSESGCILTYEIYQLGYKVTPKLNQDDYL